MHAKKIAFFNEACSLVFDKLYDNFPIPLDFDQRDIGFYDRSDLSDDATLRRRILTETLKFLREEGFILFSNTESDLSSAICQARLTTKGLTKLKRIPQQKSGSDHDFLCPVLVR